MKLFAVSHIDWLNNDLVTEFHLGNTWKEALRKHSAYNHTNADRNADEDRWFADMPDDLDEAKEYAFNVDSMIEVAEVGLWHYLQEVVAGFERDPADDAFQRGYLEACKNALKDNEKLLQARA